MKENCIAIVNNFPTYAYDYKYIVCRAVDSELWFYGAFSKEEDAKKCSNEFDNAVIVFND